MNAQNHIEQCITFNQAIDRTRLTEETGLEGKALESLINKTIIEFVLVSQGGTGTFDPRRAPRDGKLKRGEAL